MIFTNTKKGTGFFESIKPCIEAKEVTDALDAVINANPCIAEPVAKPKAREWFFEKSKKKPLGKIMKKYYLRKRAYGLLHRFFK